MNKFVHVKQVEKQGKMCNNMKMGTYINFNGI